VDDEAAAKILGDVPQLPIADELLPHRLPLHGPLEPILSDCRLQHLTLASDRPGGDALCSPLVFGKNDYFLVLGQ